MIIIRQLVPCPMHLLINSPIGDSFLHSSHQTAPHLVQCSFGPIVDTSENAEQEIKIEHRKFIRRQHVLPGRLNCRIKSTFRVKSAQFSIYTHSVILCPNRGEIFQHEHRRSQMALLYRCVQYQTWINYNCKSSVTDFSLLM